MPADQTQFQLAQQDDMYEERISNGEDSYLVL
jgi:hypothetical protein